MPPPNYKFYFHHCVYNTPTLIYNVFRQFRIELHLFFKKSIFYLKIYKIIFLIFFYFLYQHIKIIKKIKKINLLFLHTKPND
jgi:hypothetical protein